MAPSTASVSLEERLRANPDSLAFSRLADQYRKDGDIAQAIEVCTKGIEKHPDYLTGRLVLGRCYFERKNLESAADVFTQVCRKDRRNAVAIKMLADIFSQQGLSDKAKDLYSILSKMDPYNPALAGKASLQREGTSRKDLFDILGLDSLAGNADAGGTKTAEATCEAPAEMKTELEIEVPALSGTAVERAETRLAMPSVDFDNLQSAPAAPSAPAQPLVAEDVLAEADAITGSDVSDRMSAIFEDRKPQGVSDAPPAAPEEMAPRAAAPLADETFATVDIPALSDMEPHHETMESLAPDAADIALPQNDAETDGQAPAQTEAITGSDVSDRMATIFGEQKPHDAHEILAAVPEEEAPRSAASIPLADETLAAAGMSDIEDTRFPAALVENEEPEASPADVTVSLSVAEKVEEAPAQAEAITGTDISERMAMIFGESESEAKDLAQPAPAAEAVPDLPDTKPALEVPDGNTISSRIDELFGSEAAAFPPGQPAAPPRVADKYSWPADADLEETMIIDVEDTKKLRGAVQAPEKNDEPLMVDAAEGSDAALDFFSDEESAPAAAAPFSAGEELVIDEEESLDELLRGIDVAPAPAEVKAAPGESAKAAPRSQDAISGDDVAERIDGIFGKKEEPERRPKLIEGLPEEAAGVKEANKEASPIISGDDVKERIGEFFAEATGVEEITVNTAELPAEPATIADPGWMPGEETFVEELHVDAGMELLQEPAAPLSPAAADAAASPEETLGEVPLSVEPSAATSPDSRSSDELVPIVPQTVVMEEEQKEKTAVFEDYSPSEAASSLPALEPEAPPVRVSLPPGLLEAALPALPGLQPAPAPVPAFGIDTKDNPLDIPDHVLTPTLADIYFQQGQPQLAVKIYRRLLEREPDNQKLRQRIVEIETSIAQGLEAAPAAPIVPPPVKVAAKRPAKTTARPRPPAAEDHRPLAGVRLKKKAKMKWKKGEK